MKRKYKIEYRYLGITNPDTVYGWNYEYYGSNKATADERIVWFISRFKAYDIRLNGVVIHEGVRLLT